MAWPFRSRVKAETGGAPVSATDVALEAIQREVSGAHVDPRQMAVVEAAAGLWSRSIGSATVTPDSMALDAVTPAMLAHAGRALAETGNSLWAILVTRDGVQLRPAASWDLEGGLVPATWVYRLTLPGPRGVRTLNLTADSVLHFRINTMTSAPWRGRSPLRGSALTSGLAAKIEGKIGEELKLPVVAGLYADMIPDQAKTNTEVIKKGGVFTSPLGPNTGGPTSGRNVLRIQPNPAEVLHTMRTGMGQDILAAYGLSPNLFAASSDGTGQREAWRRAWASTFQPIGQMIQQELVDKLDAGAMVAFEALRAADVDTRTRALHRRAQTAKTLTDMGVDRAEALRIAGLDMMEEST